MFWTILPYIIAGAILVTRKRMSETKHPAREALQMGREFASVSRRSIANE